MSESGLSVPIANGYNNGAQRQEPIVRCIAKNSDLPKIFVTAENLYDWLAARAEAYPQAVALFAPGREPLTSRGLRGHVDDVVRMLRAAAIGRKDRVVLLLPDGPEMLTAFLATACAAEAAPLNPALPGDEFDTALQNMKITAVIASAEMPSALRESARRRGVQILPLSFTANDRAGIFALTNQTNENHRAHPFFPAAGDTALVLCTSGTTGRPKIVPSTQSAVIAGARLTIDALRLTSADRYLCVMPMYHAHALLTSLAALLAGGAVITASAFEVERSTAV